MLVYIYSIYNTSVENYRGGVIQNFLEKIISLVFLGLKETFHLNAQELIFSRSLFNCSAVIAGSEPVAISDVSSEKLEYHSQYQN